MVKFPSAPYSRQNCRLVVSSQVSFTLANEELRTHELQQREGSRMPIYPHASHMLVRVTLAVSYTVKIKIDSSTNASDTTQGTCTSYLE